MKKLNLLAFLLFAIIGFTNYEPSNRSVYYSVPDANTFLVGAMNNVKDTGFQYINSELNMNVWHSYIDARQYGGIGQWMPQGWNLDDSLLADSIVYVSGIKA